MSGTALRLRDVTAGYDDVPVLHGVDLRVADGESVAVLGPSGCGKTTLLRVVAGLTRARSGTVEIGGRIVEGDGRREPPEKRGAALVFQDLALWPHLSVAGNLELVLDARGVAAAARSATVRELASAVGLPEALLDRRPGELSGGERQRSALARALAQEPAVLLLDEPLTGLDRPLRRTLVRALDDLRRRHGLATLLVTHDHQEAFALADRVIVLDRGRVVQSGTPQEVHDRPASWFVATFVGAASLGAATRDGDCIHTALGPFPVGDAPDGPVVAVFRPAEVRLVEEGGTPGRVATCSYRGGDWLLDVAVGEKEERVLAVSENGIAPGTHVRVAARRPAFVAAPGTDAGEAPR